MMPQWSEWRIRRRATRGDGTVTRELAHTHLHTGDAPHDLFCPPLYTVTREEYEAIMAAREAKRSNRNTDKETEQCAGEGPSDAGLA